VRVVWIPRDATFTRGYGHHPLWSFVDHGPDGTVDRPAVQAQDRRAFTIRRG
jgi:hypothetical protein